MSRLSRLSRHASEHLAGSELLESLEEITRELEDALLNHEPAQAIRVAVADDHRTLRETIADRLADEPDLSVVGTAANCDEVRRVVEGEAPDVVLLDLTMPGGNGVDLIRELRPRYDSSRFLVLTMHRTKRVFDEAMEAGASGFLTKFASPVEIVSAVREVHRGGCALQVTFDAESGHEPAERVQSLSPRERAVLKLIASG
ncbi:MAG: response regulator transcription factor, partial [Myxococcota bacterium]